MFVFKVAVVGAGTMGGEIAQVVAAAGLPVVLTDVDASAVQAGLDRARKVTAKQAGKLVEKGKLDQAGADAQVAAVVDRIASGTDLSGLGDVDLVIEAVPERLELKQQVFEELDAVTPGHAILASNTSALSISEIGSVTTRPEQVIGLHFFWPAATMRLLEIVEGDETSPETVAAALRFAGAIKKTPVRCLESPGFVVNRILGAFVSEAFRIQEDEGHDPETIDAAVTEAKLAPMGPFRLADMSGLDPVLSVAEDLQEHFGDRFHVHEGLRDLVEAGELGRKSGKGFYRYD